MDPKKRTIDDEIDRAIEEMKEMKIDSEEYSSAVKNLKVLCESRGVKTSRSISTDGLIAAVTNILGILLILNYEQLNVISSKSIGLLRRS